MGKRNKKHPKNFGKDGDVVCPGYPRCSKCTEFDTCDGCETPICVYEVGGLFGLDDNGGLLCKDCREEWKSLVDYRGLEVAPPRDTVPRGSPKGKGKEE